MRDGHPAAMRRPVVSTKRLLGLATAFFGGARTLTEEALLFKALPRERPLGGEFRSILSHSVPSLFLAENCHVKRQKGRKIAVQNERNRENRSRFWKVVFRPQILRFRRSPIKTVIAFQTFGFSGLSPANSERSVRLMHALAPLAQVAEQALPYGLTSTLAARLEAFAAAAAPNSLRALKSDLAIAGKHQTLRGRPPLPLTPLDLVALLHEEAARGQAKASIARLVASLVRVHRLLDLPSPVDETVHFTLKAIRRADLRPVRQAHGLRLKGDVADLDRAAPHPLSLIGLLASLPDDLAGRRDRALIGVGYDAGLRRSELAVVRRDHVRPAPGGEGTLLIPRSKTDQEGEGAHAWLSRRTMRALASSFGDRPGDSPYAFVSLSHRRSPTGHLDPSSIASILKKRMATYLGTLVEAALLEPAEADAIVAAVSGHSLRVGVDQDLIAAGVEIGAIMQALRWASPRQPLSYARHLAARTSKVAAALRGMAG